MKLLLYSMYTLSSSYYVISTFLIPAQSSLGFISPHVSPHTITTRALLLTSQLNHQQQQQQHAIITQKKNLIFQTQLQAMKRQQRSSNKKSSSPNNTKRRTTTTTKTKRSSSQNKKQSKRSKKSSSSTTTASALEFLSTTTISPKKNKPPKKSTPPWTIMSSKDMKTHSAALKDRRRRLQSGETNIPAISFTGSADTSQSNRLLSPVDRELYNWKPFRPFKDASRLLYVGSYLSKTMPPRLGVPEVAFLGRSNVGKSSLLNKLVTVCSSESGDGARVGKTPGATASVNLYALMNRGVTSKKTSSSSPESSSSSSSSGGKTTASKPLLGLVDLPGFGYAKLSKERKQSVEDAAERYLDKRKELALGVLLLDARRVPSPEDRAVLDALYDMNVPLCIVVTKVDKVTKERELEEGLGQIATVLGLPGPPMCVSSVTGEGVRDLWKIILDACRVRIKELKGEEEESEEQEIQTLSRLGDDGDEDVSYDQGYEWSRPTAGARDDYLSFDDYDDEDDDFDDDGEEEVEDGDAMIPQDRLRIKSLKKLARRLERGGEI